MNMNLVEKLISLLPDGPKKAEAQMKLQKVKSGKPASGLNDIFEFTPHGHIRIEQIDTAGNVVGVLADQPNLVVKGAEEILLRAFSGDPERTLYKIRTPKKDSTGALVSPKYHIDLASSTATISSTVNGVDQLNFAPNVFWKAVSDADFDIYYSYRPHTMFLKEVTPDPNQVGKKAFQIYAVAPTGGIPIASEIYSSQTNMFIGLGDGLNQSISLNDARLTYSANWSGDATKVASSIGETIIFKEKISNFQVGYQKSNAGGQIEVYINNVLTETIETLDSTLTAPVAASQFFNGLNLETETEVQLKFSGADSSVAAPTVTITEIRFDALSKDQNSMIHEFENFTKDFLTPTIYSTTTVPPYMIQLNNFPIDPATLQIEYGVNNFTAVSSMDQLTDNTFYVDANHGKVYFNRSLSGLLVTYKITGEIYKLLASSTLTAGTINATVAAETPVGLINGANLSFTLANKNIVSGSDVLVQTLADGVTTKTLVRGTDYNINLTTGVITFLTGKAPATGTSLSASYKYVTATTKVIPLDYPIKNIRVVDYLTGQIFTLVTSDAAFGNGTFKIDPTNPNQIIASDKLANGTAALNYEIYYTSDAFPGTPTGYSRGIIEKPKVGIAYPWYQLDKGSVTFVADFPESVPNFAITIREMALFNGPRANDNIEGYNGFPVDAFSLVRVGETRKEPSTGIRVTWTITLLNNDNQPFTGGF